jgi:hypothetical protein
MDEKQGKQIIRFGKFAFGLLDKLDKGRPFFRAIAESLEEVGGVNLPPQEEKKPNGEVEVLPPEAPTHPATPGSKKIDKPKKKSEPKKEDK